MTRKFGSAVNGCQPKPSCALGDGLPEERLTQARHLHRSRIDDLERHSILADRLAAPRDEDDFVDDEDRKRDDDRGYEHESSDAQRMQRDGHHDGRECGAVVDHRRGQTPTQRRRGRRDTPAFRRGLDRTIHEADYA